MTDDLDSGLDELEAAAARLRSGSVAGPDAAALVQRCADLAAGIAAELERRARQVHDDLPEGELPEQERLL